MELKITPSHLCGSVVPPPSKSQAHRLIIAASLAQGESVVSNVAFSQDILATLSCMEQLGAKWEKLNDSTIRITGITGHWTGELPRFDCGESGSTLRFLIPIALAVADGGVFTGHGRLMERPQGPYFDLFDEKGINYKLQDGILTVQGTLTPGEYALPGNVSSQFFTGLLYALPLLDGSSTIVPTTAVESWDYIVMTMDALMSAGVVVTEPGEERNFFHITPFDYQPFTRAVEADWSQAGFFYAAAALGNALDVTGMAADSCQGDAVYPELSAAMAGGETCVFDVSPCPDLVPPLAVQAALRPCGAVTRLINAGRLRIKESDRLATVTQVLNALGAQVEEFPAELVILGKNELEGGVTVSSHNDHRIAMMTAIAVTRCRKPVILTGAESVAKSFPDFWEVYSKLGGKTDVVDLRG